MKPSPRSTRPSPRWMIIFVTTLSGCACLGGAPKPPAELMSTPRASYLLSEEPVEVTADKLVKDTTYDQNTLQLLQQWAKRQSEVKWLDFFD